MPKFILHNNKSINMDHVLYFFKEDDHLENKENVSFYITIQYELPWEANTEWSWMFKSEDARDLFFTHMMEAK